MIAKVYLRRRKSGCFQVLQTPPGRLIWAKWKLVTASLWDEVNIRLDGEEKMYPEPAVVEARCWRTFLKGSSLLKGFQGEIHNKKGFLTESAFQYLMMQTPPNMMGLLVRPLMESVRLTSEEESRIKRECQILWSGRGSGLKAPHPLLEEAVECMSIEERFGIPSYKTIGEIPQRTLSAMRLVSATYSDLMEMNQQSRDLQERAAQMAGLRGPYQEK